MENSTNPESIQVRPGGFVSTQWSLVLLAGGARNAPEVREALAHLCSTYWYPLYAFIRRRGHSAEDAEELTQEFLVRFLEHQVVNDAHPDRGKFRTFLLACCRHFLANEMDRMRAQKRGGGQAVFSLDFKVAAERYQLEPVSSGNTPDRIFERQWALTILKGVLAKLQQEYQAEEKGILFGYLKDVMLGDDQGLCYRQIGTALAMSEEAVRKAAQRLRQRYRVVLREQIAETVDDPMMIDDEIRDLFAALTSQ